MISINAILSLIKLTVLQIKGHFKPKSKRFYKFSLTLENVGLENVSSEFKYIRKGFPEKGTTSLENVTRLLYSSDFNYFLGNKSIKGVLDARLQGLGYCFFEAKYDMSELSFGMYDTNVKYVIKGLNKQKEEVHSETYNNLEIFCNRFKSEFQCL